jgi:hypothetical protein
MPGQPTINRTVAFVDGQNLYRCAKAAFGYHYPTVDRPTYDACLDNRDYRPKTKTS